METPPKDYLISQSEAGRNTWVAVVQEGGRWWGLSAVGNVLVTNVAFY